MKVFLITILNTVLEDTYNEDQWEKQLLRNRQDICSTSITMVLKKSRNGNPRTCQNNDKAAAYNLKLELGDGVSSMCTYYVVYTCVCGNWQVLKSSKLIHKSQSSLLYNTLVHAVRNTGGTVHTQICMHTGTA